MVISTDVGANLRESAYSDSLKVPQGRLIWEWTFGVLLSGAWGQELGLAEH